MEGTILNPNLHLDASLVFVVNSQQEFWRREFQGQIVHKDETYQIVLLNLIARGIRPIFQIDKDIAELEFLRSLPSDSVIVLCHSDETYDLDFNKTLSQLDSIHLILRPYRLSGFSIRNFFNSLFRTILNLKYASSPKFAMRVILWQGRGLLMQIRQMKIKRIYGRSNKNYRNILIGYTNIFAVSLIESTFVLDQKSDLSLFDLIADQDLFFGSNSVTFSGQVGQVIRETSINALSKIPDALIIRRNTYGASNVFKDDVKKKGSEYIQTLKNSKFVLCPPGNISGESYRIFETILMRRIPIAMEYVTSDPNYQLPFKYRGPWQSRLSWRSAIKSALLTKSDILENLASSNFEYYRSELQATKSFLLEESHR